MASAIAVGARARARDVPRRLKPAAATGLSLALPLRGETSRKVRRNTALCASKLDMSADWHTSLSYEEALSLQVFICCHGASNAYKWVPSPVVVELQDNYL